jgi:hypothetical protein
LLAHGSATAVRAGDMLATVKLRAPSASLTQSLL